MRWGPQPFEGMISVVCESFGIGPVEAMRNLERDEMLVHAVLDYRSAERAKELFDAKGKDEKAQAFKAFEDNPGLLRILSKMARAQRGQPIETANAKEMEREGRAIAEAYGSGDDSEGAEE